MAENGPIQIFPPGLLGFLQLKNSGQNPSILDGTVQPSLEMLPWLFLGRADSLQVGFAPASIGGNLSAATFRSDAVSSAPGTFNVPNSQWWYVHYLDLGFTPGAGATAWSWPWIGFQMDVGATAKNIAVATLGGIPNTSSNQPFQLSARDFFVPPGSALGFGINVTNAGADNIASLAGLITRLPI